ncbi:MmcQ/YjbR family DNA-binding protein [Lysobacter panacisoli]|uniref:MmcQ/YjbR family DNA-binding protein n=1 Tax=Lysobacter panacisoli TaxID=1255263 RepID=A0ABP9LJI7_9GAMM|nr:MmcQ/YjbR family DNA-binding protein [Lysobacter panacisoli]
MDGAGLQEWVGGWPGGESGMKWEDDLVFTVAGKMFCVVCVRGPKQGSMSFKVEDERFLELTERPGFQPAPYLARAHWVYLEDPGRVPVAELRALLRRSYELVRARLPKKTQRELAD